MPIKNSWFSMNALPNGSAEISIYDEIGAWGVTAKDFNRELKALGDVSNITVVLNTPGGSVSDGNSIFNQLKKHKAHISVEIDGIALSMGSLIAMAADNISIAKNGMMMIHNPWGMAIGDADDMRKAAEVSDKFKAGMVRAYSERTGLSSEEISSMMDEETWLDAEESVDAGFADEVTDAIEMAAMEKDFDLSSFRNVPEKLLSSAKTDIAMRTKAMPTKKESKDTDEPIGHINVDTDELQAAAMKAALKEEGDRQSAIRASFQAHGEKYRDLMDACLSDQNITLAMANDKLLSAIGEDSTPLGGVQTIGLGHNEHDLFRAQAIDAIAMRAGKKEQDMQNELRSYSLFDLARACAKRAGVSMAGKSRMDIVGAAFTHSTSDFPYLMENSLGKELQRAYTSFAETWSDISITTSVPDFKLNPRIRLGSFNSLDTIPEGGEYTHGTIGEEYENIQAQTKGKMISLTRQAIINDDLNGLMRIAGLLGRAAARTVGNDVYGVINTNAAMTDGKAIFASGHSNLAGTGAVIGTATLSAGKKAMRMQTDVNGNDYLDIRPQILLVPVALEDHAQTVISAETDWSQANSRKPNIHRNTLRVIADPRLDGTSVTAWYLLADPMDVPLLEVAFLDGNQTPYLESQTGFNIDGTEWKVRLDYGVSAIDWRGGFKNPGA